MKYLIKIALLAALFIGVFSQCKKYPEGPMISLRLKKERVANTWKIDKLLINNVDSAAYFSNIYKDYTINLTKSGSYSITYYVTIPLAGNVTNTESGTWSFTSNKDDLTLTPTSITYGNVPSPSTFQILKLYEKEMWVRKVDGNGKVTEYHLLPK